MQYMMLLSHAPGAGPQEGTPEFDAEMKRWGEIIDESKQAGVYVAAAGLKPDAVSTVRAPDGKPTVTDGPYAEAKEILFSFYIVDVPDFDAATEWAAKMPNAAYGSVEVWPMVDKLS